MARPGWLALFALLVASGCFTTDSVRPANLAKRWHTPVDDNSVQLDVALIVRPIGDDYINRELWTHTDNVIVDLERQAPLEENGLRVGQIVGMTPQGLADLLKSERWCVNPRRRLVPAGQTATQYLGNLLAQTSLEVQQLGQTQEITLDQARYCLDVTPHLAKDGGTRLHFVPKIEHGENLLPFKADPKQSAWVLSVEKPAKSFPHFAWDIHLGPGALVVIGGRLDRTDSFGHRAFLQDEGADRGQRLLVLRTTRCAKGCETSEPTLEDMARKNTSLPLALQASMTSIRAKGQ